MANEQLNRDKMLYFVFCEHRDGEYAPERNTADMDRQTTINDIVNCQIENVVRVVEWNAVEGICNDVTDEILQDVIVFRGPSYEPRRHATIEQLWDRSRDYWKEVS